MMHVKWPPLVALCLAMLLLIVARGLTPRYQAPPASGSVVALAQYPWPLAEAHYEPLSHRFPPSPGYRRDPLRPEHWGAWLRGLPLRSPGTPVVLENGQLQVPGQSPTLGAVVDMDLRRNQQCADIIYRLRAEWAWVMGAAYAVSFRATDGSTLAWRDWRRGVRPILAGKKLIYLKIAQSDGSRASFNGYLDGIFNWCGTISLERDTVPVPPHDLQVGDILVQSGAPGHAVLIVDLARDAHGRRQALFLQGWMPAQSIHIVSPPGGSGWVDLDPSRPISVPRVGRPFQWSEVRRLPDTFA